ncbi:hypothetical protein ACQ4M4_10450 [Leptolyngbya sp. AN02str]|uniref:hypothetical protein n=1 Tax=Leptolyngbya sp. AN02str TaxID=3423363 RepID=UPI003D316D12
MKTKTRLYRELELIPESTELHPEPNHKRVGRKLLAIVFAIVDGLQANTDIRIRRAYGSDGTLIWWVHDPITGRSHRFTCETELRIWLDERHHSKPKFAPTVDPYLAHRRGNTLGY